MARVAPLYFDDVEQTLADLDGANDSIELNELSMTGPINLNGNQVIGAPETPVATGLAAKEYVDRLIANVRWKGSVRVATTGPLPAYTAAGAGVGKTLQGDGDGQLIVDDVSLAPGDTFLNMAEAPSHVDHGIFRVIDAGGPSEQFLVERATNFDGTPDGEVQAGAIVHVLEGTLNGKTLWALDTTSPDVDVTPLEFGQLTGPTAFVGGQGIDITGLLIAIDLATDSGLGFSAGKLQVELDGATLDKGPSGLSVVGVPDEFEVGGLPTGGSVTAAALTALTDGSNADALHSHSGADEALRVRLSYITESAIAAGDPFYFTTTGDRIARANVERVAPLVEKRVRGVALTAGAIGDTVEVVVSGLASGVLTGATPSAPVWAAAGGGYQFTPPTGSRDRKVFLGNAINPTDLCVHVQDMGRRA